MATNDFKAFATSGGANVLTQAQYIALTTLIANGFQAGTAQSSQLNKVWRQASIMSAVLAQFVSDQTGLDVLDDGTTSNILANLKTATHGRLLRTLAYGNPSGTQQLVSINGSIATPTGAGTYVPSIGTAMIDVECHGGGGGAGGVGNPTAGTISLGAPGSSGSYGRSFFPVATIGASQVVTVGIGGTGGTNANGVAGGTTSLGSLLVAPGGPAGGFANSVTPPYVMGILTSSPLAPTGANVQAYKGAAGGPTIALSVTGVVASYGGQGGGSIYGPATTFTGTNTNGISGSSIGAGGSGVAITNGFGPAQGGGGINGVVIIREYA